MTKPNILLIYGGGGSEHEISLISAKYIKKKLDLILDINVFSVEITKNGDRIDEHGQLCELRKAGELFFRESGISEKIDFIIPCFHGSPGETGEIQAVFDLMQVPYLGQRPEQSMICFNKVSTKLWFDALSIPNTPYLFLADDSNDSKEKALMFFKEHNDIFVKAASQGSSIGCYHVTKENEVSERLSEAFRYSPYVLLEKTIQGRELEVAAYEYKNKIHISLPGEIISPEGFYSYEEKYSNTSSTTTSLVATGLSEEIIEKMQVISKRAFVSLKLRHLARIDFFLTEDNEIYLNEINTFPGMTEISMFPIMLENNGHKFEDFLNEIIKTSIES
jgi:D-alanine-D-alanine ligase